MKVIDLLVKIANEDEIPEKIRYCSDLYEIDYRYMDYKNKYINDTYLFKDVIHSSEELCNKIEVVEIIEDTPKEDKKIEKLDLSDWWEITSSEDCKPEMLAKIFNKNAKAFSSKINEIIDYINKEK